MKAHGTCLEDIQSRKCWICATATSLSRNHDAATKKKTKSIILILSSFVWELFSLFTEPSTPGRVSGSAFSESCWLFAQCVFYWALLATTSISEVAWSQVRQSEAHDPPPGKGWSWAIVSCGGVHVFTGLVREWRSAGLANGFAARYAVMRAVC